jgi:hypothetical protein
MLLFAPEKNVQVDLNNKFVQRSASDAWVNGVSRSGGELPSAFRGNNGHALLDVNIVGPSLGPNEYGFLKLTKQFGQYKITTVSSESLPYLCEFVNNKLLY